MSLHHNPDYNTPEMIAAMRAHGIDPETPSQLADAFRLGFKAAAPGWKPQRCEGCTCAFGGAACDDIKRYTRGPDNEIE